MRFLMTLVCLLALVVVATAQSTHWDLKMAREAEKLEIVVDPAGTMTEIEYYAKLDKIPGPVQQAMKKAFPGATLEPMGELEHAAGQLLYEVSAVETMDGATYDREGMFTKDGVAYSWEIQIPEDEVPDDVKRTINEKFPNTAPGGIVWEKIVMGPKHDAPPFEFHVKVKSNGKNYKVVLAAGGALQGAFLEIPAEIEVPVDLP